MERYFFDKDKLKPTSIISYGLKPLVKLGGVDSLYAKWENPQKEELSAGKDLSLLANYIAFCAAEINAILVGFKRGIGSELWTTDKSVEGRVLTTTFVNATLIVLRLLIEQQKTGSQSYYTTKLADISSFDTSPYHSSQYRSMALEIVGKYFS